LGRGLEALLGRPLEPIEERLERQPRSGEESPAGDAGDRPRHVAVHLIDGNPFQPRRSFTEQDIQELADSIATHGLLQPLVVRQVDNRYQLIAGERRLRAVVKAGWTEVPAVVREADDRQMAELAIVENLQRKDLNPLEKAVSFQQYLHQYACTQEELASRLRIDRSTIANLIRLLELPRAVQDAVREGAITQGHARALLPLGDEAEQIAFCRRIQDEGLSVRGTEQLVSETIRAADAEPLAAATDGAARPARKPQSHQLSALEQDLKHALGTKVDIRLGARQRGKIVIHFKNHDEFERLRAILLAEVRARLAG
jgi:ParB family chromosome partitioning protein